MERSELDLQLLLLGAALWLSVLNYTSRGHHFLVRATIQRSLQIKWALFLLIWWSSFWAFGRFWRTILDFSRGYRCVDLCAYKELSHTIISSHDAFLRHRDRLLGSQRHGGVLRCFLVARTNVIAHIYMKRKDLYLFKTYYLIFLPYSLEAK